MDNINNNMSDGSKTSGSIYSAKSFKFLDNLFPTTKDPLPETNENQNEITIAELGFKANEMEGWDPPSKTNLYIILENIINNHIMPNVKVLIGDVTFNCHMMVLQSYSDFFMECQNVVSVQLPEEKITPQAFVMIYDWMLTSEPKIQREGILELFNAAQFLKINQLVDQCWICFDDENLFQEDTALLLYMEARTYGMETLQQLMLMRVFKFFLTFVASKDFLLLSAKEVCAFLRSNYIGINSEVEILMSAIRWLEYNWIEREHHTLDLMNCVRFNLIPPLMLRVLQLGTPCVQLKKVVDKPEIKNMIKDGFSYSIMNDLYQDNPDYLLAFLERHKLTKPVQRKWICDMECSYHHRIRCLHKENITFDAFLDYLEMIRNKGTNYWKTMIVENEDGSIYQCCQPKKSAAPLVLKLSEL